MVNLKIIDSKALIDNIEKFKSKKICAMVKSNAYGHGLKEIVKIADDYVDYFGVVNLEEALAVRKLSDKPILICAKTFDFKKCKKNDIEVMVDNEEDLLEAIRCKNKIHLKINCGMNRFGCKSKLELVQINKILENLSVELKYIYTHFANSENARKTKKDYEQFLKLRSYISQSAPHCLGGSKIFDYDFDCEMIRLGIAMYGYGQNVRPVEKITSFVSKVFFAKKGEKIGYSGDYKVTRDGYFAIVPVGYGDGLRRCLSGGFCVKIKNKEYPCVGRICMDAFFVKIDDTIKIGDEVVIFDDARDISKDTIVYEVLTGFSNFRGKTLLQ